MTNKMVFTLQVFRYCAVINYFNFLLLLFVFFNVYQLNKKFWYKQEVASPLVATSKTQNFEKKGMVNGEG